MLTLNSKRLMFALAFISLCLVGACSRDKPYSDITGEILAQPVTVPEGEYAGVAWLSDDEIVFDYAPFPNPNLNGGIDFARLWEFQLWRYTIASNNWTQIVVPKSNDCPDQWFRGPERIDTTRLGFIYECELNSSPREEMKVWSATTLEIETLIRLPEKLAIQSYAFQSVSNRIAFADQGMAVNDKIYVADSTGVPRQYFTNFARAASPSWSNNGETIAFAANETLPQPRDNPFTALVGIGDFVFYPWNLYVANADGTSPQIILQNIKLADRVKWSPTKPLIAFGGQVYGLRGIWILNTTSLQLTRVWTDIDRFDWSPDGTHMVVLKDNSLKHKNQRIPVIIDVSEIQ